MQLILLSCYNMSAPHIILAKELAENSHVQDAFVIAVEQQAKERLERLSALRKIKPVDMSTLSQQVSVYLTFIDIQHCTP